MDSLSGELDVLCSIATQKWHPFLSLTYKYLANDQFYYDNNYCAASDVALQESDHTIEHYGAEI
jgi:hypothetical protein